MPRARRLLPPRAASTVHFDLDDDGDVLAARPTPLVEVRPQPGVLRHTGAHIVDFSPFVQILDDPVPQMGEGTSGRIHEEARCAGAGRAGYRRAKISLDRVSKRCPHPRTRRADRLVEVPTIISYSSLQQRTSGQIVDIPVPHGRGLQGFLQDRVQRLRPLLRTCVLVPWMSRFKGFFRTFSPYEKKVRGWVRTRGRNWVRTLIHGLRRLVPSPWRALTTSLRRRRRWWWRRVQ